MADVIIKGFRNEAAAKEFLSWYSCQGEQTISEWWWCRLQDGKDVGDCPSLDRSQGSQQYGDGNIVFYVKN